MTSARRQVNPRRFQIIRGLAPVVGRTRAPASLRSVAPTVCDMDVVRGYVSESIGAGSRLHFLGSGGIERGGMHFGLPKLGIDGLRGDVVARGSCD